MSKLNRICVAISIIGSTIASGIVIVSCSPKHNMFEQYDFNTPIQLKSKKQSRQLFEIAITKIPNSDQPFDFNDEHSAKKTKVNDLMRSDVFEEYSKNIFYWEMAYNIASYGKQWNFKNKDSNTWLEIRQQDSSWFIKNDGSEAPPFAINNIVFDYFDATGALQKAQTFNSSTNIELDYNSDNQTPWCFYNADMNTPLFRSFMCSNFAQF